MKNSPLGKLILLLSLISMLTSCEHKDLCIHHDEHSMHCGLVVEADYDLSVEADYRGRTDEELFPQEPEGLRMLIYSDESSDINTINFPVHGGKVSMTEGHHSLLFYNNDTEYIVFDDLTSSVYARASTRSRSRNTYQGNSLKANTSEKTVNPPDMLFGAYIEDYNSVMKMTNDTIQVTLHPLVYSYIIYFNLIGHPECAAYAQAALAGMAGSVYINSGMTSDEEVTVLFDSTIKGSYAESIVKSFGIPGYPSAGYARGQRIYALNFEVRLIDGSTLNFDFDVTDQVETQPHGGVIVVNDIEIPLVENTGSAAPFDVDVVSWGPYEEIPISM